MPSSMAVDRPNASSPARPIVAQMGDADLRHVVERLDGTLSTWSTGVQLHPSTLPVPQRWMSPLGTAHRQERGERAVEYRTEEKSFGRTRSSIETVREAVDRHRWGWLRVRDLDGANASFKTGHELNEPSNTTIETAGHTAEVLDRNGNRTHFGQLLRLPNEAAALDVALGHALLNPHQYVLGLVPHGAHQPAYLGVAAYSSEPSSAVKVGFDDRLNEELSAPNRTSEGATAFGMEVADTKVSFAPLHPDLAWIVHQDRVFSARDVQHIALDLVRAAK